MAALTIKAFRGQVPRVSDRLLEPNRAKRAMNCKITSGRLEPLRGLGLELTSTMSAIKSIFRYRAWSGSSYTEQWFTWRSDVDAVLSPIANDSVGRVYFTSEDFEPRMTTRDAGIGFGTAYPSAWYALGVFAPTAAPTISSVGGSGTQESRTYLVTYVTALGEESAPSPAASVVTGFINGSWTVSGMQTAPPNSGTVSDAISIIPANNQVRVTLNTVFGLVAGDMITLSGVVGMTDLNKSHRIVSVDTVNSRVVVNLVTAQTYTSGGSWAKDAPHNTIGMTKRIYRSAGTVAAFLFVAEIAVGNTTYLDAVATADLGEEVSTSGLYAPPKNLTCLITLPNGCLVGLSGNEVCFSEPSRPYAWPDQNRYSFAGRGVALVPAGNSVIVLTESSPILYTGSDPSGMSPSVMETYAPCVSKRAVANIGGGCIYPSFDGLWMVGPGVAQKVTTNLYRIEEWAKLNPSTMIADYYDGQYYARYIADEKPRILIFNFTDRDSIVEVDDSADAMFRNEFDGRLYIAKDNKILSWDSNEGSYYESDWQSVDVQLGRPLNFAVAQVHADYAESRPIDTVQVAANEALMANLDAVGGFVCGDEFAAVVVAGSNLVPVSAESSRKVQFTLYKGGTPVFTKSVDSVKPFRLPAGYRTEVVSVGINASSPTYSVTIAESFAELAGAS
jgi:hypothetical protein